MQHHHPPLSCRITQHSFARQAGLVSWEGQWAWEREAADGRGEQNGFSHSSHRFSSCPQSRGREGRDHVLSSPAWRGSAPIHHLSEPCTTASQNCKSSQLPQHFFSHGGTLQAFSCRSRAKSSSKFSRVIQLKRDCIFRQNHSFMCKDKTDYLGPSAISLLSISLRNRTKLQKHKC